MGDDPGEAVPATTPGAQPVIEQQEEITETYKPSLKFKDKFAGKSVGSRKRVKEGVLFDKQFFSSR